MQLENVLHLAETSEVLQRLIHIRLNMVTKITKKYIYLKVKKDKQNIFVNSKNLKKKDKTKYLRLKQKKKSLSMLNMFWSIF